MNKETASSLRAMDVVASTTFRTFSLTNQKKMVVHLDQFTPYYGNAGDKCP
jgi:hypothetical protein